LKYLPACLFAVLFFICALSVIQYGDETFHPKSILVEKYTVNGNNLDFKINSLENNYSIKLPKEVTINKKDEVKLSYQLHQGKIIEIEEIIVNEKSVWDVSDPNRIEITITDKK
jgi:hypothetical protein